jgi:hypothetical protein
MTVGAGGVGVGRTCAGGLRAVTRARNVGFVRWLVDGMNVIGARPDSWWKSAMAYRLTPPPSPQPRFTFPAHLGSLGMKRKRCPNILLANIYRCPIESGTPTLW